MRFALLFLALPLAAQPPAGLPDMLYSGGAGGLSKGHGGTFAYVSLSKYIGQNNYATVVQQYTDVRGKLSQCSMAGVSHVAAHFGPLAVGVTGLGGACDDNGEANGAAGAQGFLDWRVWKWLHITPTAQKTFTSAGNSAIKLSLALGFGK